MPDAGGYLFIFILFYFLFLPSQLKPTSFMGMNNMGIFNCTFSHSGNRKSTIGNGEKFIDKTSQYTEVRFACFLSSGFTNMAVINPPERQLAKWTSVQCGEIH